MKTNLKTAAIEARTLIERLSAALALPHLEACQAYAHARYDWPIGATHGNQVCIETLS